MPKPWVLFLAFLTALSMWGPSLPPPPVLRPVLKNQIVQWAFVYLLVLQGASNGDPLVSAVVTGAMFLLYVGLHALPPFTSPHTSTRRHQAVERSAGD